MDFTKLKDFMERLTAWRIPGNAAVVYYKGEKVFEYSSGYSDVESKTPMKGDELFNIYSCSKPVTCVAALQLLEQGKYLLDDPISDYIPEYKEMYVKDVKGGKTPAKTPITFRHLFTMSAGLDYDLGCDAIKKAKEITKGDADTVVVAKCLAESVLDFEPGTRWSYSLCHDVLAALVEIISGEAFEDYVRNHIFAPLGVTDVHFRRTPELKERMASQYNFKTEATYADLVAAQNNNDGMDGVWENIGKEVAFVFGPKYDGGGAGMVVSVPDYAKFANALANDGRCPDGSQILSKGTIDLMRQDQLQGGNIPGFDWAHLKGYSWGLGVRTMVDLAAGGSNSSIGEFGWDGAGGCYVLVDPDRQLAMFYAQHMTNCQGPYVKPRLRNVLYSCID